MMGPAFAQRASVGHDPVELSVGVVQDPGYPGRQVLAGAEAGPSVSQHSWVAIDSFGLGRDKARRIKELVDDRG